MPRTFECPKCGADISDSYEQDDPEVGIIGGWSCDNCNEGFTDSGPEPFDDDVHVHIDRSDIHAPQADRCPRHPELIPEMGYGLAGGGIGVYSYCSACGAVLSKSQDHT